MSFWFDFVIFFFLIMVGAYLVELVVHRKEIKKKLDKEKKPKVFFLYFFIFLFLSFAWLVIFYGSVIEPRLITISEYEVELSDNVDTKLRVAILTDLHVGSYKREGWIRQVVDRTNELKPDQVWLVGDYVSDKAEQSEMLAPLVGLVAPQGVYAVTGNHDYRDQDVELVVANLQKQGIKVLRNETVQIGDFVLAGVNDLWYEGNLSQTLQELEEDESVVLLSHNPDAVLSEITTEKADLVVSGHTHGGQIRLPWLGAISDVPDVLGCDYDQGLFDYKGINLLISSGLSETGPRARLFNPPEIVLLNLWF
jgi:uncharacterized protein